MEKIFTRTVEVCLSKEFQVELDPKDYENDEELQCAIEEYIWDEVVFDMPSWNYKIMDIDIYPNETD